LKANGYNLDSKPNCSISTIHAAKGGEADHVVLLSDMAYRSHQEYVKQPDNERRVAYVGVTRAKEKLSIVLPQSKLFFDFYGESQ
jgi:superfamily I DNA/RNA helicase